MNQEVLEQMLAKRLNGSELFSVNGINTSNSVSSFWSWAYSTLAANNLRGHLAEYIVASALGVADDSLRVEWDAYDLVAFGLNIEVKSAAYLQSWKQEKLSTISFSIAQSCNWETDGKTRKDKPERNSDVYIFCLLTHKDKRELNPLNLEQWAFYVLPTTKLEPLGSQKTITLNSLHNLNPAQCKYEEIGEAIKNLRPFPRSF